MNLRQLVAEAEDLCRAIAPELADVPLYVVTEAGDKVSGCYSLDKSLQCRPQLESERRWRGPGVCFTLHPQGIAGLQRRRSSVRAYRKRDFSAVADSVAIHELGHAAADCFRFIADPGSAGALESQRARSRQVANGEVTESGLAAPIPFFGHARDWIRACLHLNWRAQHLAGRTVFIEEIVNPIYYGLSALPAYVKALGDEPERMANKPFAEIMHAPEPLAFRGLFRADLLTWAREQPKDLFKTAWPTVRAYFK